MTAFVVSGVPAPKGSRISGRRKDGSIFTRPASKGEHIWVEAVAEVAKGQPKLPPPYSVELHFSMPRPKKPSHEYPTRGDLDKLVRAVLDGLTRGGVIVDDRHVTDLSAAKFWAEPGDEGVAVAVETVSV
jgi:Holliday junction resolvase RusA-like endonuclease